MGRWMRAFVVAAIVELIVLG